MPQEKVQAVIATAAIGPPQHLFDHTIYGEVAGMLQRLALDAASRPPRALKR